MAFLLFLQSRLAQVFASMQKLDEILAQLVEHDTFNVGVLGSSPRGLTPQRKP